MKVPLSWLNEYIPTQLSLTQIADALTLIGLEVESTAGRTHLNGSAFREQGVAVRNGRHAGNVLQGGRCRVIGGPHPDAGLDVQGAAGDGIADLLQISQAK